MNIRIYLSLASLLAFPLLLGSVVGRPYLLLPQLLFLIALVGLWTFQGSDPKYRAPRAFQILLLAWGGIGLLQSIPLPPSLVGWISPDTLQARQTAGELLGQPTGWIPFTFSPSLTLFHAGIFLAIGLAAPMWAALFERKRNLMLLLGGLTGTGVFLVLFGLVQMFLPSSVRFESVAPNRLGFDTLLMNDNNLSSFLFLSMGSAFSLMFMTKRGRWRLLAGLLGVVCGVGIVLSLSRTGIVLLVVVNMLAVLLFARSRLEEEGSVLRVVEVLFPLAFMLAFVFLVADVHVMFGEFDSAGHLMQNLSDSESFSKTYTWILELTESARYPLIGVGVGAFQVACALFLNSGVPSIYPAAENIAVQQLLESGWFFGALLTLGLFWISIRPLIRLRDDPALYPVALTLFAVFLGDFFDYALYTPGVLLPWAALAAVLHGIASGEREENDETSRSYLRFLPLGGTLLAAFVLVSGFNHLPQHASDLFENSDSDQVLEEKIAAMLSSNPLDGHMAMTLADSLDAKKETSRKKKLYEFAAANLANAFHPRLALARMAQDTGNETEMVHQLDLALESCPPSELSCMKAIFDFPAPTPWFSTKLSDPDLAFMAISALSHRFPPSAWELSRIRFSMDKDLELRIRDTEIRCALAKQKNEIPKEMCRKVLQTAIDTAPDSPAGILFSLELQADLYTFDNEPRQALDLYPVVVSGPSSAPATCRCLEKMLKLYVTENQIEDAEQQLERLREECIPSDFKKRRSFLHRLKLLEAYILRKKGNLKKAERLLREIIRAEPDNLPIRFQLFRTYEQQKNYVSARRQLEHLLSLCKHNCDTYREELENLKRKIRNAGEEARKKQFMFKDDTSENK